MQALADNCNLACIKKKKIENDLQKSLEIVKNSRDFSFFVKVVLIYFLKKYGKRRKKLDFAKRRK